MGPIYPSNRLRKGDSLSSYLFILCVEGLSAMIKRVESKGEVPGFGFVGMPFYQSSVVCG